MKLTIAELPRSVGQAAGFSISRLGSLLNMWTRNSNKHDWKKFQNRGLVESQGFLRMRIFQGNRLGLPVSATGFVLFSLIAGCSTSGLVPEIEAFGKSVSSVAESRIEAAKTFQQDFDAARRADLAAVEAAYKTSDAGECSYVQPALGVAPLPFDEACLLLPKDAEMLTVATVYDPLGVQNAADYVAPTQDENLARKYLALEILKDLGNYADGLKELATTEFPQRIGASTSKAYSATAGLIDAVGAFDKAENKPSPKRKEIGNLLTLAATEIVETMRYRRLRDLVEYADPFVQRASVQLALQAYENEKDNLKALADDLDMAIISSDVPDTTALLKRIEDKYAALSAADKKADFRIYSNIGLAHKAILVSLENGHSIKDLAKANERIQKLVDAVDAVVD